MLEDSPVTQKLITKMLEKSGLSVTSVSNQEEFWGHLNNNLPDLILMDVILTDGNGKKVVQELQRDIRFKKIPIIFVTNTLDIHSDDGYAAFDVNGTAYRAFAKPLHFPKLISVIKKEINRVVEGHGPLPAKIKKVQ